MKLNTVKYDPRHQNDASIFCMLRNPEMGNKRWGDLKDVVVTERSVSIVLFFVSHWIFVACAFLQLI